MSLSRVKEKLSGLFCQQDWIREELWSICCWPIYRPFFFFFFYPLSLCHSCFPHCTCFLFSFYSRDLHFIFFHISAASLPHFLSFFFPAYHTAVSMCLMRILLLCLCLFFFSHQFCCSTSVKSAADVHIMPYNTLVINHVSLFHQPRYRHSIWPNKWPTYGWNMISDSWI